MISPFKNRENESLYFANSDCHNTEDRYQIPVEDISWTTFVSKIDGHGFVKRTYKSDACASAVHPSGFLRLSA